MDYVENRTFDEIKVGDSASLVRTLTRDDISLFAVMSGDVNPAHVDEEYAKSDPVANLGGGPRISAADSSVSAWAIPTNEELMIARHTVACVRE